MLLASTHSPSSQLVSGTISYSSSSGFSFVVTSEDGCVVISKASVKSVSLVSSDSTWTVVTVSSFRVVGSDSSTCWVTSFGIILSEE